MTHDRIYVLGGADLGGLRIQREDEPKPSELTIYEFLIDGPRYVVGRVEMAEGCASFAVQGTIVYALSPVDYRRGRLTIYDTTLPDRIVTAATIDLTTEATGVAVEGDRCYVLTEKEGLIVIDVSLISSPSIIGKVDVAGSSLITGYGYVHVAVPQGVVTYSSGRRLGAGRGTSLAAIPSAMAAGDGFLCVMSRFSSSGGWTMSTIVVDRSGRAYEADSVSKPSGHVLALVIDGEGALVFERGTDHDLSVSVFDLSDPSDVRESVRSDLDLELGREFPWIRLRKAPDADRVLVLVGGGDGSRLAFIDISDPATPTVTYRDEESR